VETVAGAAIASGFFNLVFWLTMAGVQKWESHTGRIPSRSGKFLYMKDFHTNGWADFFALTLVDMTVGALIAQAWSPHAILPTFLLGGMGVGSAAVFAVICLAPNHKPDWGYPEAGKISWGGRVHLVYFGFHVAYVLLGFGLLLRVVITGAFLELALLIGFGLFGLLSYIVAFILDVKHGNFVPASQEDAYSESE